MKLFKSIASLIFILLILPGCSVEPKPIPYGEANCAHCNMTVADNRFGAELINDKGKPYFFDSTECLAAFINEQPELGKNAAYLMVTDFTNPNAELTSQLDITKSEEELLADMRKTTRYEIRKAEKLGIKIATSKDEKLIKPFYDLQLETAKRQNFVPFSYKYFFEQFKVFFESDNALLYTATFENKILAQAFIIFYNTEAVYHYAVSTEEGRRYPGAYLLQWEVIKEAKRRGMKKYNFWGVAPVDSKDHRFSGISIFKRGFGGEDVQYLHAHDLIINYPRYAVNFAIEQVRKVIRRV